MNKKTVFIIGASGGVGSRLAEDLAETGYWNLGLGGRDGEKTRELAEKTQGHPIHIDARNSELTETAFEEILEQFGCLNAVVNCAGSVLIKPAHLTSEKDWEEVIGANLTTAFNTVRQSAKSMPEGGSVVLISSVAASTGLSNHEAIAAAKAGVEGLMRSAATTYAAKGLRFNAVAPALVRTPATLKITENARMLEVSEKMHPLGRIGEPGDISRAIQWLIDPDNSWVTGQVIGVDGGLSKLRTRSGA